MIVAILAIAVTFGAAAVPVLLVVPRRSFGLNTRRQTSNRLLQLLACGTVALVSQSVLISVVAIGAGLAGPWVARNINSRHRAQQIERAWPAALEVLSMGVGVGMPVGDLLDFAVRCGPPPLRPLFESGRSMLLAGATRRQVLIAVAAEGGPSIRPVVDVLIAAERDGASVALVLDRLAAESSRAHRMAAEERARRAPVLMLAPLTLCCLPAVLIGTIAPFVLLTFGQTSF